MTDFRALCAAIIRASDAADHDASAAEGDFLAAIDNARAALDEPEKKGPDHASLIAFAYGREPWATWLKIGGCLESAHCELSDLMTDVLARWGNSASPALEPTPVSERPWEREGWCDAEGRCWFCNAYSMGKWTYETAPDSEQDWGILGTKTHSLPHWAIARPRPEAKEPT
jgi:hypothetical protein